MKSRLLSAIVAGALAMSSSVAIAQSAPTPAPATETVAGDAALFGNDRGATVGIAFLLTVFVFAIFADEIFGDDEEDDDDNGGGIPVSP